MNNSPQHDDMYSCGGMAAAGIPEEDSMKDRYFSHDCNALNDNKIIELRGLYGMEGYGVYWGILEALSRTNELELDLTDRTLGGFRVAFTPTFDMRQYIDDCIDIGLFITNEDGTRLWSESMKNRDREIAERADGRSEAARKSATARWDKFRQAKQAAETTENEMVDTDWKRVMDAYQQQLGILPMGLAGQKLMSYVEDLGADAMIVAIQRTNAAQPDRPWPYLKKILDELADKGVKTGSEAEAVCNDFDRKAKKPKQPTATITPVRPTETNDDGTKVKWL